MRRTSAVLSAVAVAATATVAACAGESGPPSLTWYINPDDGGQDELAERCTEAADGNYQITTSLLPREAPGQREQLARRLAAGDTGIDLMNQFNAGESSFMVNWPFVWAATNGAVEEGNLDEEFVDDIGWASYPSVGGEQVRPPYGGISLGISAFSDHSEQAIEAAQCITAPDNQAFYFVNEGNPAAHTDAYNDSEVQEAFPMADLIRESLEQAGLRPHTPYYNEVSEGVRSTWHPPGDVRPDTSPSEATTLITEVLRGERLL